jgi:hypothetical protein
MSSNDLSKSTKKWDKGNPPLCPKRAHNFLNVGFLVLLVPFRMCKLRACNVLGCSTWPASSILFSSRLFYTFRVGCPATVSVCADDSMQGRNRSITKVAPVLFALHQFECETGCNHQLLKPASLVPIREHVKEQFPFQLFEKYFDEEGFVHGQPPTTRPSYERDAKNFHDSCQQEFRPFSRRVFSIMLHHLC